MNANFLPASYLRGCIIGLVVAHHSVLAYAYYGHFDPQHYLWSSAPIVDQARWIGFDVFALFNDAFFMSLMFFLSGLFIPKAISSADNMRGFLVRRVKRLGIPFAFMVLVLVPIAYYPSIKMTGVDWSLGEFWRQCVFVGPWPGGPAWFLWVLLTFDVVAAACFLVPRFESTLRAIFLTISARQVTFFVALWIVSMLVYLPMAVAFGTGPWLAWGPFSVQTSRILLYALYFFVGVGIGTVGWTRGILEQQSGLAAYWQRWLVVAALAFGVILGMQLARERLFEVWGDLRWTLTYGSCFVLSCAASITLMLALAVRFGSRPSERLAALSTASYGIFIVHYIFVIWIQYLLLPVNMAGVAKAVTVFLTTLMLSFAITVLLRRSPMFARVI